MNTALKLRICNRGLGATIILMLASGIQLEVTSGRYAWSVWTHIILGLVLSVLSFYHIYLHYRFCNWFSRFARNRNAVTRILWWVFILTAISGVAATVIWLDGGIHSHIGAVHGKIGFLMVAFAAIHIFRHLHSRRKHS